MMHIFRLRSGKTAKINDRTVTKIYAQVPCQPRFETAEMDSFPPPSSLHFAMLFSPPTAGYFKHLGPEL